MDKLKIDVETIMSLFFSPEHIKQGFFVCGVFVCEVETSARDRRSFSLASDQNSSSNMFVQ